jgi:HNH endonuclease
VTASISSTSECVDHGQTKNLHENGYANLPRWHPFSYMHREALARHLGLSSVGIRDKMVLHSCDNPRCINPDHLRLGDHADNMRDKVARGRQRSVPRKLTFEQAEAIRAEYRPKTKGSGIPDLARKYGLGNGPVWAIITGKTYKRPLV